MISPKIMSEEIEVQIYEEEKGPWPFKRSDCLYCDRDSRYYAYFNDGRNVVRRFCDSEQCKEKAISEVKRSVQKGSVINPLLSPTTIERILEMGSKDLTE